MRVASYHRISRAVDDSTAIKRQRLQTKDKLSTKYPDADHDDKPWTEGGDRFEDEDISAYQPGVTRPAFDALMDRIDEYDAVVFWKLDRFVRRLREWVEVQEIADEAHTVLISVEDGMDTSNPMLRAMAAILVTFAELESATIGLRVADSIRYRRTQGKWIGGKVPFGYRNVQRGGGAYLEVNDAEAQVLRRAAKEILAGANVTATTRTLNSEGLRNRSGRALRGPAVSKWLRSPAVAGYYANKDMEIWRDGHGELLKFTDDAVLDVGQWKKVTATMAARAGKTGQAQRRKRLLTGLLRCASCESSMRGQGSKEWPSYGCPAGSDGSGRCNKNAISAIGLHQFVNAYCLARLTPEAITETRQLYEKSNVENIKRLGTLDAEKATIGLELDRLEHDRRSGLYDGRGEQRYRDQWRGLMRRIDEIEREVSRLQQYAEAADNVVAVDEKMWNNLDDDRRRVIIDALIQRINITKGVKGTGPVMNTDRIKIVAY